MKKERNIDSSKELAEELLQCIREHYDDEDSTLTEIAEIMSEYTGDALYDFLEKWR